MRASSRHDAYFPSKGNLVDLFCAKALYCGLSASSDIIGESALHIGLLPSRGRLPVLDQKYGDKVAREFQSKFLAYRCHHILDVRAVAVQFHSLEQDVKEEVLGVRSSMPQQFKPGLIHLLQEHEQKRQVFQLTDLRCVVIEALLQLLSQGTRKKSPRRHDRENRQLHSQGSRRDDTAGGTRNWRCPQGLYVLFKTQQRRVCNFTRFRCLPPRTSTCTRTWSLDNAGGKSTMPAL